MGSGLKFWWIQWFEQYKDASINYQFNILAYEGHDPWHTQYKHKLEKYKKVWKEWKSEKNSNQGVRWLNVIEERKWEMERKVEPKNESAIFA